MIPSNGEFECNVPGDEVEVDVVGANAACSFVSGRNGGSTGSGSYPIGLDTLCTDFDDDDAVIINVPSSCRFCLNNFPFCFAGCCRTLTALMGCLTRFLDGDFVGAFLDASADDVDMATLSCAKDTRRNGCDDDDASRSPATGSASSTSIAVAGVVAVVGTTCGTADDKGFSSTRILSF